MARQGVGKDKAQASGRNFLVRGHQLPQLVLEGTQRRAGRQAETADQRRHPLGRCAVELPGNNAHLQGGDDPHGDRLTMAPGVAAAGHCGFDGVPDGVPEIQQCAMPADLPFIAGHHVRDILGLGTERVVQVDAGVARQAEHPLDAIVDQCLYQGLRAIHRVSLLRVAAQSKKCGRYLQS